MSTSISTDDSDSRGPSMARSAQGAHAPLGAMLFALLAKDLRLLRGAILMFAGACGAVALVLVALPLFGEAALEHFGFMRQSTLSDRTRVLGPVLRMMAALFPLVVGPILLLGDRTRGASVYSALLPVPASLRWFSKILVACAVVGAFVGVGVLLQRPEWWTHLGDRLAVRYTALDWALPVSALALVAGFAGAAIARGISSAAIVGAFLLVVAAAGVGGITSLLSPLIVQTILSARRMDPAWIEHLSSSGYSLSSAEVDPVRTVVANCSSSFVEAALVAAALAAIIVRRRQMLGETGEAGENRRTAPRTLVFACVAIVVAAVLSSATFAVRAIQWTSMWKPNHDDMVKTYTNLSALPLDEFVASFLPNERPATDTSTCDDYLRRIASRSQQGLGSWSLADLLADPLADSLASQSSAADALDGRDLSYFGLPTQSYRVEARGRALRERVAQDPVAFDAAVRRVAEAGPSVPFARRARAAGMLGNLHRAALAAQELASATDACGRLRAIFVLSKLSPTRGRPPFEFLSDEVARGLSAQFERAGIPPFEISPTVELDLVSEARARAVVALVMLDAAIERGDAAELASAFGGAAPKISREEIRAARRIVEEPIPELAEAVGKRGSDGAIDLTPLGDRPVRWSGMRASELFVRDATDPAYLAVER